MLLLIPLLSIISLTQAACNCQNKACNMNTGYKGTQFVQGVNEFGLNLTDVRKCQEFCRDTEDCTTFSFSENSCLLLTEKIDLENDVDEDGILRPSPEVSYRSGSMFGAPNCDPNCACAKSACLKDRTFGTQNNNIFPNMNSRIYFTIPSGDINECRKICIAADECNYISFSDNVCFLKWARTNPIRLEGSTSESIIGTIIEKHVFLSGDDLLGPSLMAKSSEKCKELCNWHEECAYWTFTGSECFLKTGDAFIDYASKTGDFSGDKTCNF